jgi:hypothetical protein
VSDKFCLECNKKISWNAKDKQNPHGCWCGRWWCSEECVKNAGYIFQGDSYDTDDISCKFCRPIRKVTMLPNGKLKVEYKKS